VDFCKCIPNDFSLTNRRRRPLQWGLRQTKDDMTKETKQ
jgi:hypothetical protein